MLILTIIVDLLYLGLSLFLSILSKLKVGYASGHFQLLHGIQEKL